MITLPQTLDLSGFFGDCQSMTDIRESSPTAILFVTMLSALEIHKALHKGTYGVRDPFDCSRGKMPSALYRNLVNRKSRGGKNIARDCTPAEAGKQQEAESTYHPTVDSDQNAASVPLQASTRWTAQELFPQSCIAAKPPNNLSILVPRRIFTAVGPRRSLNFHSLGRPANPSQPAIASFDYTFCLI